MARIPLSIWRDPEFIGLGRHAQYLWFVVKTSKVGQKRFDPQAVVELSGMTLEEVFDAEARLRATPYATVFIPRKQRPFIPDILRRAVMERDEFTCRECGSADHLSLDHIHPYSLGGLETLENLRVLCRSCNSSKGAKV